MAVALYRRYRPASFAEVRGQDHVTGPLRQALSSGRVHHAYLFSGPRGCGKTSSARILARSLNCAEGPTPDPCGRCESCVALAPDGPGSLDVIEIDAASHNGVDDARDLRERAFYAPVSSRFKVYIIDEAHMVTPAAFNALLKLVEEPPEFIKLVFATTEPDKVIDTIRSRTFHYPFKLLAPRELQDHLAAVCAAEGAVVEPAVLGLVVRAAAGSVRDALSVLDQLLAGSGPEGIGYEAALALLGFTDVALLDAAIDAMADHDGAALFGVVDRVVEAGLDPRRFAGDLLQRVRDLLVLAAVPDAAAKGLVDAPADGLSRMAAQASRLGIAELTRAGDLLNAALVEMRGTLSPRLVLELTCARVLLPAAASDGGVLVRLERLERAGAAPATDAVPRPAPAPAAVGTVRLTAAPAPPVVPPTMPAPVAAPTSARRAGAPPAPAPAAAQKPAPAPAAARKPAAAPAAARKPAAAPAPTAAADPAPAAAWPTTAVPGAAAEAAAVAGAAGVTPAPGPGEDGPPSAESPPSVVGRDVAAVRAAWEAVRGSVRGRRRTTAALLESASVVGVEGETAVVGTPTSFLAERLSQPLEAQALADALAEVLGGRWRVRAVHAAAGAGAGTAVAAEPDEPSPDDADDPAADLTGVALLEAQLGAKVIGEVDTA